MKLTQTLTREFSNLPNLRVCMYNLQLDKNSIDMLPTLEINTEIKVKCHKNEMHNVTYTIQPKKKVHH